MDQFNDVAVIGGGITGASAANHLVAAGYSTLLLEQGDFASGTTGRTSRLQYSGLSYLAGCRTLGAVLRHPGDALEAVGLARRAMRDRSAFIRSMPERVRPVSFHLPVYRDGPIAMWQMLAGLKLMEQLDPGGIPLEVDRISAGEARRDPCLKHLRDLDNLVGVVRCVEHQFNWPERICLDTVLNARENGALIENYTRVESVERGPDGSWIIHVRDRRGGQAAVHRARSIVNAAGAWVDEIAVKSSLTVPRLNQGEKGSNIVVRLPEEFRDVGFEGLTRSGEPFYIIPWGALHYFGPCNRPHDANEDGYRVTEEETTYLLGEINYLFPILRLKRDDVLYGWAGVRPKTARPGHASGGDAVRVHDLGRRGAPGYFVYTGGLLMTHRSAGREIVAALQRTLKPSQPDQPILERARISSSQTAGRSAASTDGMAPAGELNHTCENEKVFRLEDLMFRRISLGWGEHLGCDIARDIAHEVRNGMGWSALQAEAEANRYIVTTTQRFGLKRG